MRLFLIARYGFLLLPALFTLLSGCATNSPAGFFSGSDDDSRSSQLPLYRGQAPYSSSFNESKYASRLPQTLDTNGKKTILVEPDNFAWGAYDENGMLVRAGIASAGADFCADEGRPCRTTPGTYRIYSLGNEDCRSKKYPLGEGGSLMPYCMFFNGGESLHGAPDQMMVERHMSHGCVRVRIPDAEWIRYNFASIGTRVIVRPY